ncbi:hypothetical protein ACFE04_007184 [Oxalis oulophora]
MGCGVSKFEQEEFGCAGALKRRHNHQHYGVLPVKERQSVDINNSIGEDSDSFERRKDVCVLPKDKIVTKKNKKKRADTKGDGEEEMAEDESGSELGGDSILFPGSPSFREYCHDDAYAGSSDGDKSDNHKGSEEKPRNRKLGMAYHLKYSKPEAVMGFRWKKEKARVSLDINGNTRPLEGYEFIELSLFEYPSKVLLQEP